MSRLSPCPCSSGRSYAQCCEPLHLGTYEAREAVDLMRSRYSAFALRKSEYLWKTLHAQHPDREMPRPTLLASIRRSCETGRFMGLTVLDTQPPDEHGIARVLFYAKVFHKGRDLSITECSDFARDDGAWRYLAGRFAPRDGLRDGPAALTIAAFLATNPRK